MNFELKGSVGSTLTFLGKEFLYFGGTSYLGLNSDQKFRSLIIEGIERYGVNNGTSRNNNVSFDIYAEAEKEAARRFGAEDAIIVSSGYIAGQLATQFFQQTHHPFYLKDSHPALKTGKTESSAPSEIVNQVNMHFGASVIYSNSLNNLFPQKHSFKWVYEIEREKQVILLVDDSHGLGTTGENGMGVYQALPETDTIEKLVVASMAKGLGIDAGILLGKKATLDKLRTTAMYAGASPPSPAFLYAFLRGKEIYQTQLTMLMENIRYFSGLISGKTGISYLEDFPVFLLHDADIYSQLIEKGIVISSFPYPDPTGKRLNRIVLNSLHTQADLDNLFEAIS